MKMSRIEKRFQLLLTGEEIELLKKEAAARGISAGELLRMGFRNEIADRRVHDRIEALNTLVSLAGNQEN